MFIPSFVIRIY